MNNDTPPIPAHESLNYSGLERHANYRIIAFRQDILHILDKKESAAILFQILYRWETEVKREEILKEIDQRKKAGKPPLTSQEIEDRMWIYMSYNDFVRESGGSISYNTVVRLIEYLKDKKVFEQRKNHDPRYPDYEYRINKDVVRDLLAKLPKFPTFAPKIPKKKTADSTQMGIPTERYTQMGIQAQRSTQMGIGSTQMGIEVYPNGGTSHNYTHNYTQEGTVEHCQDPTPSAVADRPTDPLVSFSDQVLIDEITRREKEKLADASLTDTNPTGNTSSKKPVRTTRHRHTEPLQKPLPKLEEPQISEAARAVWEVWLSMPWNQDIPPKLTEIAAGHCETLSQAKEPLTKDTMFKIRNFAEKNDKKGYYKGKKWTLGNMVTEYPNWKSAQYQPQVEKSEKQVVTVGNRHMQRFS